MDVRRKQNPLSHGEDLVPFGSGLESELNWDGGPASVAERDRDRDIEEDIIMAERTWRRDAGMERAGGEEERRL